MADARVRIYKGPKGSTVIGMSASAAEAADHPDFATFMSERGYEYSDISRSDAPKDSVSIRHIEVRPPMSQEHIKQFGSLCVGGIIDAGHNSVWVLDNRSEMPDEPVGQGAVIARD